jgi:hypothetical protein
MELANPVNIALWLKTSSKPFSEKSTGKNTTLPCDTAVGDENAELNMYIKGYRTMSAANNIKPSFTKLNVLSSGVVLILVLAFSELTLNILLLLSTKG